MSSNLRRRPLPMPPSATGRSNKNANQASGQSNSDNRNSNANNTNSKVADTYRKRSPPSHNRNNSSYRSNNNNNGGSYRRERSYSSPSEDSSRDGDRGYGQRNTRNTKNIRGGNSRVGAKSYRDRYASDSDRNSYSDSDYDDRAYSRNRRGGPAPTRQGNNATSVRKTIGEGRRTQSNSSRYNDKPASYSNNNNRRDRSSPDESFSDTASDASRGHQRGRRIEGRGDTNHKEVSNKPATIVNGRMQRKNEAFSKKQTAFNSELERLKSILNIDSFEEALGVGGEGGVGRNASAGPEATPSLVTKIGTPRFNTTAGLLAQPVTMPVLYLTNVDPSVLDCHLRSICQQFGSSVVRTSRARNKENDELLRRMLEAGKPTAQPTAPISEAIITEDVSVEAKVEEAVAEIAPAVATEPSTPPPPPPTPPAPVAPKITLSPEEEYFRELQRSLRHYHEQHMQGGGNTRSNSIPTIQSVAAPALELLVQFATNEDMARALALLNGGVVNGRTVYCGVLCSKVGK